MTGKQWLLCCNLCPYMNYNSAYPEGECIILPGLSNPDWARCVKKGLVSYNTLLATQRGKKNN